MIRLPDVPALQDTPLNLPTMNPRAAAAPAMALGQVASAINSVGEHFQGVAMEAQKLENFRVESEARTKLASDYATFQTDLQTDPDPASRISRTREFFAQSKGALDDPNLPPAVRTNLLVHHDEFASHGIIRAAADAADLTLKRAGLAADNEMAAYVENGDAQGAVRVIDRLQQQGVILPEQADAKKRDVLVKVEHNNMVSDMQADPSGWLTAHPVEKVPTGFDPVSWGTLRDHAKTLVREHTYEDTSTIQDAIAAGKITRPEQIDSMAPYLRPHVKEQLKGALAQTIDEQFKAKAATPEYQQATVGQVSAMLADYNPQADDYDAKFVQMDGLTRTLPPGAARDELERRIKEVRSGKLGEVKTLAEAAQNAIEKHFKTTVLDKLPTGSAGMTTQTAVDEGFLKDWNNLKSFGFSDDQAAQIKDEKKSKKQVELFRDMWTKRQVPEANPGGIKASVAMAIINHDPKAKFSPEEEAANSARLAAEIQLGKMKIDLGQWLKLHDKATAKEIDDKVFEISGRTLHADTAKSRIAPRPQASATPLNHSGMRVTSFGYQGDPTPDSNSSKGIGAFTTQEDARATASAPTRLRPGDISVSPDVERQLRQAGIEPRQQITVRLANGGTHRGRWMDRTADNLTGRIDLYSPDGIHNLDGSHVVGLASNSSK